MHKKEQTHLDIKSESDSTNPERLKENRRKGKFKADISAMNINAMAECTFPPQTVQ